MPTALKILGQNYLSANTNTLIYTVPAVTEADATLNICNNTSYTARVSIAITANGGTLGNKDYLISEKEIKNNENFVITDLKLDAGTKVYARANRPGISINLFGSEIT